MEALADVDRLTASIFVQPGHDEIFWSGDDAMNWCWGDAGAYYIFVEAGDLQKLDFSKAQLRLARIT